VHHFNVEVGTVLLFERRCSSSLAWQAIPHNEITIFHIGELLVSDVFFFISLVLRIK
jgi:hypothetical protein